MSKLDQCRSSILNDFFTVLLVLGIIFSGISFFDISVLGISLNILRVFIPICFLYFFIRRIKDDNKFFEVYDKEFKFFIITLLAWLIWGAILLKFSAYGQKHRGAVDILMISMFIPLVFSTYEAFKCKKNWDLAVSVIRIIMIIFTLGAIFEMSTGRHLGISKALDPKFLSLIPNVGDVPKRSYLITGIFYNMNDFSAFMGIFVPAFFPSKLYSLKRNLLYLLELTFLMIVIIYNDSWIALISILIGTIFYIIITRPNWKILTSIVVWFVLVHQFGVRVFYKAVEKIYEIFFDNIPNGILNINGNLDVISFTHVIQDQAKGYSDSHGSMYSRIFSYLHSIRDVFLESFGFGLGPHSYPSYYSFHNEKLLLLNPHSYWIEIMFEYGVFIFVAYLGLMLYAFLKLFKMNKKNPSGRYTRLMAMDIIFIFICFAPSSYLHFPFLWIIIGATFAFISQDKFLNKGEGLINE